MNINILFGVDGARNAKGVVVIIDVFRAASTAAYILNRGAQYIIPVSTAEEAFKLKEEHPEYVLVGEDRGYMIDGFDLGNSPHHINQVDLINKIVVFRSSQGTQGIVNAINADEIIFGSFPQAKAIVDYIIKQNPEEVSLVALGSTDGEDYKFAEFLKSRLLGEKPAISSIVGYLRQYEGASRFLDPNIPEFPSEDFDLCLSVDIFDFFPIVTIQNGQKAITKS